MGTSHYKVGEVVVIENGTAIEAIMITLGTIVTLTIMYICQLKTMPYLYVLQFIHLQTIVEVELTDSFKLP